MLTARFVPAVLFYLVYAAGIQVFVLPVGQDAWPLTALNGALFGLFTYATYDLTNYATLRGWTAALAVSDIAWGRGDDGRGVDAGHVCRTGCGAMADHLSH